ncbi:hypothetical protein AVEN_163939-1 [Araneus ventricosus]|uniref:Uncharacterized protein n=1 Tax=Araneus ventricosus TaxID=182803 RepID=A0A4Y2S4U2_ARAVE|nr:hypothetical protein AVEN_128981-1 [Araneus ventricosus]GBN83182.1 hypothetical protein AVEN_163939-1 [Araneus ventricosus]
MVLSLPTFKRFHLSDSDYCSCGGIGTALPPCHGGSGGLVVWSRLWGRRIPGSKPDYTEDPPCMGPVARQIIRSGQTSSRWCGVEVWRGCASSGVVLVI